MAFLKSLKRAFGFDAEEIEDDFPEGIDATVTPLKERMAADRQQSDETPDADEAREAEADAAERAAAEKADEANRQLIFRHTVRLINESLPQFLSSAIDPEEQERYLLNALDDGMKQYLADLERRARRDYDDRWAREKSALDGQFESLREKVRKGEVDEAEAKKLQLSAERQKRALTERVRDLEKQVDSLQAENEQYLLENKSLVNKLRVCAVQDAGGDGVQEALLAKDEELQRLREENGKLTEALEAARKRIEELDLGAKEAVATHDLSQAMVNDLQSRAKEALTRAEEAEAKLVEANDARSELSARVEELSALAEQSRADAESARAQAEESHAQLTKARQQLKVVQEVREQLGYLEQEKIASDKELESLRDAAKENEVLLEDLRSDVRRKNTALAQRDACLRQAEEEKRRLEDLTDSLRKTIENNLHHQAQSEALLRSEIDRLKNLPASETEPAAAPELAPIADAATPAVIDAPQPSPGFASHDGDLITDFSDFGALPDMPSPRLEVRDTPQSDTPDEINASDEAPKPRRGRGRKKSADKPKISAIDETLDSTNWLIATPPASRKAKAEADAAAAANEFGYQEPTRRQPPESPAQMLLW
ncbi:MAG: hypothetical protein NC391_01575 [Alistipes timonensis]|nr:hypothetical protein [Alistipes timonensis]